jgi:two-component system sensor histidine kinase UhpB
MGAYGPSEAYWTRWRVIFLSEALAFLTIPPAVLGWAKLRHPQEKKVIHWTEAAILMGGVVLLGYVISISAGSHIAPALFYALVPFLLWSALRFGPMGLSTSIIIVAFLSIWGTIHGRGLFTSEVSVQSVLSMQLFLLCAATPFMVLAALAEQHKQTEMTLRELGGRLITAQEEERKRLSRELHDDLSQRMARLLIRLERWRHSVGTISEASLGQFNGIVAMASDVSASLRDLSHLLHPGTLSTLGLVPSIAGLCRTFSEEHALKVTFEHEDALVDMPPEAKLCIFRVVQESLRNVVKHSGAKEARVILARTGNTVVLRIEDLGSGFELPSVQNAGTLGLISMRERARLVGGQLSVISDRGCGTRVYLQVRTGGI